MRAAYDAAERRGREEARGGVSLAERSARADVGDDAAETAK
jgi:hypothetical protein